MKEEFVNLTPHPIILESGIILDIPVSGQVARLNSVTEGDGIIRTRRFGQILNLPEPKEGIIYITSSLVMAIACQQGRTDVVAPAGDIRDEKGRIIGTTYFVREN